MQDLCNRPHGITPSSGESLILNSSSQTRKFDNHVLLMLFFFVRRHEDSEEEDDKRSGKKHRKDKGKDRHKSKDQGAPDASPGGSASEPEPAAQEALPSPEKPIRDGTHQRSDSEEGQL